MRSKTLVNVNFSPYMLTKETTVRKILAQREGKLDTVVVPESSTELPGSATEI